VIELINLLKLSVFPRSGVENYKVKTQLHFQGVSVSFKAQKGAQRYRLAVKTMPRLRFDWASSNFFLSSTLPMILAHSISYEMSSSRRRKALMMVPS